VNFGKDGNHTFRTSVCSLGRIYDPKYMCAVWHNKTCPECQIKDQSNCSECIKYSSTCGWCPINYNCEEGDFDGPYDDLNCIGVWLKNITQCFGSTTGTTSGRVTTSGHLTTGKSTTSGQITTGKNTTSTTTGKITTSVITTGKLTTSSNITTGHTTTGNTTTGKTSTTGKTTSNTTTGHTTGTTGKSTTSGNKTSTTTGNVTSGHITSTTTGKLTTTSGHTTSTTGTSTTSTSTTGSSTTSTSTTGSSTTSTSTTGIFTSTGFAPLVPPTNLNPEPNYDNDIFFTRDIIIGISSGAVLTIFGSVILWRLYKSQKTTSYQVIKGNDKKV